MSKIYQGAVELIGNTPLVEVTNLEKKQELKARVLVKLEYLNPAGSVKDRIAKAMLEDAEQKGKLKEGSVIIEPTSGNTGIGLAAIAASKGYRVILTMPETMSVERRNILKAYGAEIVLTQGVKGMKGAIERARELAAEIPNSFIPGQFENPANPEAHRKTTGPEIWRDTDGKVDFFVAGVGTGGTVSGTGEYLKSQNPDVKIVAVEPADSPVLAGGKPGPHKIQGIGAGFVPQTLNTKIYDDIFEVQNDDAFAAAKLIAKHEAFWSHFFRCSTPRRTGTGEEAGKCRKDDRGSAAGQRRPVLFYYPVRGLRKTLSSLRENITQTGERRKYHKNFNESRMRHYRTDRYCPAFGKWRSSCSQQHFQAAEYFCEISGTDSGCTAADTFDSWYQGF